MGSSSRRSADSAECCGACAGRPLFPPESPRVRATSAAGRLLAGLGVEQLPVVLLSLVGLTDGTADNAAISKVVDAVIDEVAETQLLGAGFRPIFLLDTPAFTARAATATWLNSSRPAAPGWANRWNGLSTSVPGLHR